MTMQTLIGGGSPKETPRSMTTTTTASQPDEDVNTPLDADLEPSGEGLLSIKKEIESLDFIELVRYPKKGSIIAILSDRKMQNKKSIDKLLMDVLMPQMTTAFLSGDLPLLPYFLFRLVLPHQVALEQAEIAHQKFLSKGLLSELELVGQLMNMEGQIKERGDIRKVIMKIGSYHPPLATFLMNVMKTNN